MIATDRFAAVFLALAAGAAALGGCGRAKRPPAHDPEGGSAFAPPKADPPPFRRVEVFFGTDREEVPGAPPDARYSERTAALSYGVCHVSIPRWHKRGELEEPHWYKLERVEDPEKHVVLLDAERRERADFVAELGAAAAQENNLLLFIHGYNVTFKDAARRTAQIAFDVGYPGVPLLYSWPSAGATEDYFADEDANRRTQPHLAEFLSTVAGIEGVQRLDVIAHSMGNRALCEALARLGRERSNLRIRHLVLAAPDIDAKIFIDDIWPAMRGLCEDVTLYASSDDQALVASGKVHKGVRLGQSGPEMVLLDGLATIDATGIDTSLLGHSYVAEVVRVLDDLDGHLTKSRPPADRGLFGRVRGALGYWAFR